jgi:hypothetical protein
VPLPRADARCADGSACRTIARDLAFGAGSYAVPGAGTASFGFAVALAPHSQSTYVGQLNVITPGKWWLQGNVTGFGNAGSGHGVLAATGSLCSWNSTLDRGHGGWQFVKAGRHLQRHC